MPPEQLRQEFVADVVRSAGYVAHTRDLAERAGCPPGVHAELQDIAARLNALHFVALVAGGWCPRCSAEMTDPRLSPSGTRHCRSRRIGWTLAEGERQVRAVERAWPTSRAE